MKDLDRDALDLGSGDIRATFRRILFPTLLGMLASSVFGITDGIFVGRGVGSDGLAAVNIVMPIFTLGTAFGLMFGTGTSVVAAIHLSQQNVKAARIVTTQSFLAVLIIGVLLAVGFYAFAEQILTLLGASDALRVRRTFRLALVTSVSVATVSALLFHFFADAVVSVFLSPTSSAFPLCRDGFALFVLSLPPMALSLTAISYFQSVKRTRTANFLTLLRSLLLPVPAFLLLPLWSQTRGPWLASPLSECLVIAVVGIYALAGAFRKLPPTP